MLHDKLSFRITYFHFLKIISLVLWNFYLTNKEINIKARIY